MARYDDVTYWDDRYNGDKEPFEWYLRYNGIRHFLTPKYLCCKPDVKRLDEKIKLSQPDNSSSEKYSDTKVSDIAADTSFPSTSDCRVLITGCGNSEVGQEMLSDGFRYISNIDFSSVVIRQMEAKYTDDWYRKLNLRLRQEKKGDEDKNKSRIQKDSSQTKELPKAVMNKMTFECTDMTKKLLFADESFDLILCKGLLDAILCNTNSRDKVRCMMTECHRVLDSRHGVMIVITYGDRENRIHCFDTMYWKEVKIFTAPKPLVPCISENIAA